jgi:endonuclease YncB( thermonuclease family)
VRTRSLILLVLLVTLTFLGAAWLIVQPCLAADLTGKVVGIIDGDTLEVLHRQQAERIRLNGIDCPEKRQAYGQRAKQAASELVFGKEITRQTYDIDTYGHTIADVILLNLNRGRNTRWDLCESDC